MAQSSLPILILAAGQSARMRGTDKLLQDVDGLPLLRRQAIMARSVTQGPVIVTLPPDGKDRRAAIAGVDVTPLTIPDAATGMSASLRHGIAALAAHRAVMILLADLPELEVQDLQDILQAVDEVSDASIWRGATKNGKSGHPLVISAALFQAFSGLKGDNGGRDILATQRDKTHLVPLPGDRALRDLDTPEDWQAWRAEKNGPVQR
jgi:CTP:molybdopterin cytidylyltransferase MocA